MKDPIALALLLPLFTACGAAGAPLAAPEPAPAPAEESVKPGINENYLDPDLDVGQWAQRFEGESREVFVAREAIVEAIGIEPGMDVADVGSGTGAFLAALDRAVGEEGSVIALDIVPKFVEHLAERAQREGLQRVVARKCGERSVELPPASIDLAFLCDVYHHFEYPRSSMGSIAEALRPGGEVVIVDFHRIPGVSREWILGHVRAGQEEVFAELDSFGFELVEELEIPGLEENWAARFRKR